MELTITMVITVVYLVRLTMAITTMEVIIMEVTIMEVTTVTDKPFAFPILTIKLR